MSRDERTCPVPLPAGPQLTLAHGGGGRAMGQLLRRHVAPALGDAPLRHDAAVVEVGAERLAFTTDGFVVTPLVFPGGDLGRLAVFGTVNDLAMAGADPVALSLALIGEEGLPLALFDTLLASVAAAAAEVGVGVVTGDTKVVERGRGDGLYATTSGIGRIPAGVELGPWRVREGDVVLVSGDVGRHGVAVLSVREGLAFDGALPSDCAPLVAPARALRDVASCLRDCTRGGLAAAVTEIAEQAGLDVALADDAIPVAPQVRAACELLGLDPVQMACEGRLVAFVPAVAAEAALAALRALDPAASRIGVVRAGRGRVWLRDPHGGERLLDRPYGDPLPRIC